MSTEIRLIATGILRDEDRDRALRAGFDAVENSPTVDRPIYTVAEALRAIRHGERDVRLGPPYLNSGAEAQSWQTARLLAPFLGAFGSILLHGKLRENLNSVRGGLVADETFTGQLGSILWIENPRDDLAVTGSVLPVLPEVTVAPQGVFAYVHDAPIGVGARYLGAYAGLVKSDADILSAEVLPDPLHGIRVYVYGAVGTTREVALWTGNDRGRGVDVTFSVEPRIYRAGPSQIVALPDRLAAFVWGHPTDSDAPVLIGPLDVVDRTAHAATVVPIVPSDRQGIFIYSLTSDGTLTRCDVDVPAESTASFDDTTWTEIGDLTVAETGSGCYRAHVSVPDGDARDFHLYVSTRAKLSAWMDGTPLQSGNADGEQNVFHGRLKPGENILCLFVSNDTARFVDDGSFGAQCPVTIVPDGGCYVMEIGQWRYRATEVGDAHPYAHQRITVYF